MKIFGLQPGDESVLDVELQPLREECEKSPQSLFENVVLRLFSADIMLYPISAITAIGYMFVALIFVWTAIAPLTFTGKFGYWSFVFTFLPYFMAKFFSSVTAYTGKVSMDEIWNAQEVWFGYAFAAVIGILDAVRQHFTGKGLSWGVTGEAERRNWLEYFNVIIVSGLSFGIIIRLLHLFLVPTSALVDIGAIFFASTIAYQMWPMVSMSLYEWTHKHDEDDDELNEGEDLKRITVPTYLIYVVLLAVVIGIGLIGQESLGVTTDENDVTNEGQ